MDHPVLRTVQSKKLSYIALLVWAVPLSLALSLMLGLHFVPHKKEPLLGLGGSSEFEVHHFLSLKCQCSRNLVNHLLKRHSLSGVKETVHLVYPQEKFVHELQLVGFIVEPIDEEDAVKKFNLQALPQLVVTRENRTLYQGGYGRDQQHSQIYEDEKIIKDLFKNRAVGEFPIFGCANGHLRKKMLDILGVKYGPSEQTAKN
jgi:hypothetical protein